MKGEPLDKRTAVLEATLKLIAGQGFHGTPMSQIAEKANISVGTIYHYFDSKEELINELYIYLKTKFSRIIHEKYPKNLPPKEHFILISGIVCKHFIENPDELFFFEQYNNSPLITAANHEKVMRLFQSGQKHMEKAIKDNIVKDLPIEMIHALIHGGIVSLAKFYLSNKTNFTEESMSRGLEAIWDMIKK